MEKDIKKIQKELIIIVHCVAGYSENMFTITYEE